MTSQNGKEILARIKMPGGGDLEAARVRNYNLSVYCEPVDEEPMLDSGIPAADGRIMEAQESLQRMRFEVPGVGMFEENFLLIGVIYSDEHDGPECEWESADAFTFEAVTC